MSTQGRYPPPPGYGSGGPGGSGQPGSLATPLPPAVGGSASLVPKPITGSPQSLALHAMTIDPSTGLPRGEKPPASTAAVVSLVCGILLCLGPFTGITAIIAGLIGRRAAAEQPHVVGGSGMSLAGVLLGIVNLLISAAAAAIALASLAG